MDAYEATKMVFSRIQTLDPDNAATVMGVLLIQDPGEQEMIRLAFGPDSFLRAVINESMHKHHHQAGGGLPAAASPPQPPTDFHDDLMHCASLHNAVVGPRGGAVMAPAAAEHQPQHQPAGARCHYFTRGYCKNGPGCRFFHHHGCMPSPAVTDEDAYYQYQNQLQQHHTQSSPRLSLTATTVPHHQPTPPSFAPAAPSPKSVSTLNHLLRLHHLHNQRRLLQRAEDEEAAAAATLRLLNMPNQPAAVYPSSPTDMLSPASRQIYLTFPADSTFTEEDVSIYFSIYGPVQDVRIPYQQKRMFGFVSFVYPETVRMVLAKGNPHFVCDSRVLVKPYKEKPKLRDTNRKPFMAIMSERCDFYPGTASDVDHSIFHPLQGARMALSGSQDASILLRSKLEEEQHPSAVANVAALQHAIELQRKRFSGLQMLDLTTNHRDVVLPQLLPSPPPAATTLHSLITTAATTTPHHLPGNNGTSQDKCFDPDSETKLPLDPPPLATLPFGESVPISDAEYHPTVQPTTLDLPNIAEEEDDVRFVLNTATSQAAPEGRVAKGPDFTECVLEQSLPDIHFPPSTKLSLIHNSLSTISEEFELLNPHPLTPAASLKPCFQMPRISAGRGAVGM